MTNALLAENILVALDLTVPDRKVRIGIVRELLDKHRSVTEQTLVHQGPTVQPPTGCGGSILVDEYETASARLFALNILIDSAERRGEDAARRLLEERAHAISNRLRELSDQIGLAHPEEEPVVDAMPGDDRPVPEPDPREPTVVELGSLPDYQAWQLLNRWFAHLAHKGVTECEPSVSILPFIARHPGCSRTTQTFKVDHHTIQLKVPPRFSHL